MTYLYEVGGEAMRVHDADCACPPCVMLPEGFIVSAPPIVLHPDGSSVEVLP